MKPGKFSGAIIFIFFLMIMSYQRGNAQDCNFSSPVVQLDFGNNSKPAGVNLSILNNYSEARGDCPNDGTYAFLSSLEGCFQGHWHSIEQDHTAGDAYGKMLVMNASYPAGLCFVVAVDGLKPNTNYEFGVWLANVCNPSSDCTELRPNLLFVIGNEEGKEFAKFSTGDIALTPTLAWLRHAGIFTTPANAGKLVLKIINQNDGGCGNDFAMDDITLRECILPKAKPIPVVNNNKKTPVKPSPKVIVKSIPIPEEKPTLARVPGVTTPISKTTVTPRSTVLPTPTVLLTRQNPIVKKIVTSAEELLIELYDNGDIDGDSVSIYHNNALIVSGAALSAKAISFSIKVDAANPHHELVMVANNLGSIPPNTSVMIVTARNRRHEIFISSSEQKNAKITIDLQP